MVALLTSMVMVLGGLSGVAWAEDEKLEDIVERAFDPAADSDGDGDPDSPDEFSASVSAKLSGEQVEDLSARSEVAQTFAQPDGTFLTRTYAGIQRVEDESGAWLDVDPTLEVQPDGSYAPKVSAADVIVSGGGESTATTLTLPGETSLSITLPENLPAPTIEGPVATYAIDDNTDLMVIASKTGVSVQYRINERPQPGEVPNLTLGLETEGLDIAKTSRDALKVTDDDGKAVLETSGMTAWDAETNDGGDPANVVPVEPTLTEPVEEGDSTVVEMGLAPAPGFLEDPATSYPVIVDPTWFAAGVTRDTTVNEAYAISFGSTSNLLVGRLPDVGTNSPWMSYVQFDSEGWMDKPVFAARAYFQQYRSGLCTPRTLKAFPLTSGFSASNTVWANRPSASGGWSATFSGMPSCASGTGVGQLDLDVTSMVRAWSNGTLPNYGLQLSIPPENASDGTYGRALCSANEAAGTACPTADYNPYLDVLWNTPPDRPQLPVTAGLVRGDTFWANSANPLMLAISEDSGDEVEDPMSHRIDLHDTAANGTQAAKRGECYTPWTASGEWAGCTPSGGALTTGSHYWARAMAHDAPFGELTPSGFSDWNGFKVDSTTPPAPAVSCTGGHVNNQWYETRLAASITCTATSSGAYEIVWNKNKSQIPTSVSGGSVSHTFDVPTSGVLALDYTARSRSGNSATASYTIGIGTSSILPVEEERTSTTVPMTAQSAPGATSAKVQWRPAGTANWTDAKKTGNTFDNVKVASTNAAWTGTVDSATTVSTVDLIWSPNAEPNISAPSHVESRVMFTYQNGLTKETPARSVQVVPHAFGGSFPSQDLGPGQVALFTGEFQLSETDVNVPAYSGSLSLGRSHLSLGGATTGPAGVFGPGWTADLAGPDYGVANYTVDDRRAVDGSIYITSPDGESYGYGKPDGSVGATITGRFNGLGEYAVDEDYVTLNSAGTELKLTEADGTVTTFTKPGAVWLAQNVVSAEASSTVTYAYSGTNVSWIFAPKPGGVTSCSTTSQTAGCRALELIYTTVDSKTRLSEVKLRIWDPKPAADGTQGTAAAMEAVSVAKYSYTADGKLTETWDPRIGDTAATALKTAYTYDTVGGKTVVKTVDPPGNIKPWTIHYDSNGRVKTVTRAQDADAGSGDATWTVKYGIGLSANGDGLPNLSAAATTTWGQPEVDAPLAGAAVFGPDQVPDASPTASQYEYADLSYWTPSGRTSNTATYGAGAWQIGSTRYDDKGNPVWQLTPAGKAKVLGERDAATGTPAKTEATNVAASKYAALTIHTTGDNRRVKATYGPMSLIRIADTGAPTDVVLGRKLTRTTYDDTSDAGLKPGYPVTGVPAGGFGLAVEETERVSTGFYPYEPDAANKPAEYDVDTTRYTYDPVVPGDGDGWTLKSPTRVKVKVKSSPDEWATTLTRFDTEGKVIETRTPEGTETTNGTGTDTRSTKTTYYTVGANSADALCGSKPQWAGLVCTTTPGGGSVPSTRVSGYSMLLSPTRSETSLGGAVQADVTAYDAAGRTKTSGTTTSGLTNAGGQATNERTVPVLTTNYSDTTGLVTSITGGGKTQTTTYDTWGRVLTATDGAGSTATKTYDAAGRVKTSNDGKAAYTYTYNGTDSRGKAERRGLVTSLDVGKPSDLTSSAATTFTGAYDDSGALAEQIYPGGVKATWVRDLNGVETGLSYRTSDNVDLFGYANTVDVDGRVVTQNGGGSSQEFTYDKRDRLTEVKDTRSGQCTTRKYGFSGDSNRKTLTTYAPASGGGCQTSTGSTVTSTFNEADQMSGDTYDGLGRTTRLATGAGGASTLTYHANDMVATITQGSKKQDYTLDLARRVSRVQSLTSNVILREATNHYDSGDDSPAWTGINTRPDAATAWTESWERNVADLTGDLGLIQKSSDNSVKLQLANLHGDVAATYTLGDTPTFVMASAVDEYGKPIGTPDTARYGWLGAKQRDATATAGLTLMGVRLYNPVTGRFLSRDPVPGGNDNTYTYPADPTNESDISGACPWCLIVVVRACIIACKAAAKTVTKRVIRGTKSSSKKDQGKLDAHAKKTGAKNSDRVGHTGGKNSDKHTKAQGYGGKKKWVNPNAPRRPGPQPT